MVKIVQNMLRVRLSVVLRGEYTVLATDVKSAACREQ